MTSSGTGSAVQDSDSPVELVSVSAEVPFRYSTRSHVRASSSTTVPIKIRIQVPRTGLAPTSTRIPPLKPGAPAVSFPRSIPSSRIPSFSPLPSFSSTPVAAPTSSAQPAQPSFSFKRPHSSEDHLPSKRACSKCGHPSSSDARKSTPDLSSVPVPRREGRTPASGPLPRLPGLDAWEWLYG